MSRLGRSFFGLPGPEDPELLPTVSRFKVAQLSELRFVAQEVGGYEPARRMPVEIRRWWIQQMQKKDGAGEDGSVAVDQSTGKRYRTQDVR